MFTKMAKTDIFVFIAQILGHGLSIVSCVGLGADEFRNGRKQSFFLVLFTAHARWEPHPLLTLRIEYQIVKVCAETLDQLETEKIRED